MSGSVVQFSGKALEAEFSSFVGAGVVGSRDFGRGDGEFVLSNPAVLALNNVLTAAVRPEATATHGAKAPATRFQTLNS